jgi:ABC-type multidrug transport system fused ATPase/permease subunit
MSVSFAFKNQLGKSTCLSPIEENIRYGKDNASAAEIEEAAKHAKAHDFILQLPDVCIYHTLSPSYLSSLLGSLRNMKEL